MVYLVPLPPHHLLLHENPDLCNLSGSLLTQVVLETGVCIRISTTILEKVCVHKKRYIKCLCGNRKVFNLS